jgi:small-conductance mechanosensitive channel
LLEQQAEYLPVAATTWHNAQLLAHTAFGEIMAETNQSIDLLDGFSQWLTQTQALLAEPTFWVQFVLIGLAFVLSYSLVRPLILAGLKKLSRYTDRISSFNRIQQTLQDSATPIGWLLLQWLSIKLAEHLQYPSAAMVTVTSLLAAWLLIRLAAMLISDLALRRVIAWVAWSVAALNIFGWLTPAMDLLDSWAVQVGTLRLSPLTAFKIALSLWFALWLATAAASLVERKLSKIPTASAATQVLFAKLARVTFITLAILIALSSVGIDLTALAIFSGALGVGLGFGLQKIFSNLISGVILLMDRSLKPGDVVAVNNTFGWINHLGARYASVITRDGTEHLIPNEEFITQRVENWSYSDDLVRLRIPIGIAYHANPREAIALCIEAAQNVPRVQANPAPKCQLVGFGDSSVDLELRIWINDPPNGRANVCSDVLLEVWDKFHEHGIEIPFPQRDLHVKSLLGEEDLAAIKQAWVSQASNSR